MVGFLIKAICTLEGARCVGMNPDDIVDDTAHQSAGDLGSPAVEYKIDVAAQTTGDAQVTCSGTRCTKYAPQTPRGWSPVEEIV